MEEVTEAFPGVILWENFDKACQAAEEARAHRVEAAEKERNRVVQSDPNWMVHSRERINATAEARYARKVKAAEDAFEAACRKAEEELMVALDEREKARNRYR